jgi:hypothetical protein
MTLSSLPLTLALVLFGAASLSACDPRPGSPPKTPTPKTSQSTEAPSAVALISPRQAPIADARGA